MSAAGSVGVPVELQAPDISSLRRGNRGIDYVTTIDSGKTGPHLVINALIHGNEISGPIAILRLLDSGLRPKAGKLTISLANIAAYERFDPSDPTASRFVEEDMNRLWRSERLLSDEPTIESRRARELLPIYEEADFLLDLHSMQTPSPPLMLSTIRDKGKAFARSLGRPASIVADAGHANGTRLIDHGHFADPDHPAAAILLEAGQHWAKPTAEMAFACVLEALRAVGLVTSESIATHMPPLDQPVQRVLEVTRAVTIGEGPFVFAREFHGLETIAEAGTVIGSDNGVPVTTPYDDCVLVMPSRRLQSGLTAVRLARVVG